MEMNELDVTLDPREERVIKFDFNATIVQITNLEKDKGAVFTYYLDEDRDVGGVVKPETYIVIDKRMWTIGEFMVIEQILLKSHSEKPISIKLKYF